MISAWARMCKIIGPESFLQYLPFVIKPLIQAASVKPEIAIVDCELIRRARGVDTLLYSQLLKLSRTLARVKDGNS